MKRRNRFWYHQYIHVTHTPIQPLPLGDRMLAWCHTIALLMLVLVLLPGMVWKWGRANPVVLLVQSCSPDLAVTCPCLVLVSVSDANIVDVE